MSEDEGETDSILEEELRKEENILYKFETDLDPSGRFSKGFLYITTEKLLAFYPETGEVKSYPLSKVKSVRYLDHVGGGELEVEINGRIESLVRFTRAKSADFRKAAIIIDEILTETVKPEELQAHEEEKKEEKRKADVMIRLVALLKPHWKLGLVAMISSLLAVSLSLIPPMLMKQLIDDALANGNVGLLAYLAFLLVVIYVFSTLFGIVRGYTLSLLGEKIVYELRRKLYEHVERLPLSFHDRYGSGRLISRISDDTSRIRWFLTWGIQSLIISTLQIAAIGVLVFTMNPYLTMFALIPVPVIVLGIRYYRSRAWRFYHRIWRKWADVSAMLVDTVPGTLIVKSFSREKIEAQRFGEKLWDVVKSVLRTVKLRLEVFPLMGLSTSISIVLIWWFGGLGVIEKTLSLGTLTAFVSYMWQFYGPINTLSTLMEPLQTALTSAERVFEILDMKPETEEEEDSVDLDIKGRIKFENVSFGYEPNVYVLRNVSFEIEPGEVVGIVGPSGSGKTTLTKLLLRLYTPDKGRILIDGVDICKIKLRSLRRQIGVVQQEPLIFSGSVADNIAYGVDDAEPEEIIAAAKAAKAHEFIMSLPAAYDTHVGERGGRLSGGERQRVAIARAILTDPKILVLDEATSSVDTITEKQIQAALNNLVEGRTTIIIAHRLSTVKNVDKIIVMKDGRIVEIGRHDELIRRKGLYAELWQAQFEEEKISLSQKVRVS